MNIFIIILFICISYYIFIKFILFIIKLFKKPKFDAMINPNVGISKTNNFINDLFKELEIDLLRYPIYNTYYKDTLKKRITENIKEHYYEN